MDSKQRPILMEGERSSSVEASVGKPTGGIVHAQQSRADRDQAKGADVVPKSSREGLCEWWKQWCQDALSQQQEAVGWWCEFAKSCADVESWTRKNSTLGHALFAASVGATEGSVRLTLEQQEALSYLIREGGYLNSALSFQVLPAGMNSCSHATEMARAWMGLSASTRARIMKAWAEFWSLPSTANSV